MAHKKPTPEEIQRTLARSPEGRHVAGAILSQKRQAAKYGMTLAEYRRALVTKRYGEER